MAAFAIRPSTAADRQAILALYVATFPKEDLSRLVAGLLWTPGVVSLVGVHDHRLAGHIAFTPCRASGGGGPVALLGPLAVAPRWQGRGLGSALVRAGLARLAEAGARAVFVLGDPDFYGRFGFSPATAVVPPYPLPAVYRDGWQCRMLGDGPRPRGTLAVPPPWRDPALWAP